MKFYQMNKENESGEMKHTAQPENMFYTLITVATEGIGKALALEFASRGLPILLVALPGLVLHLLVEIIKNT